MQKKIRWKGFELPTRVMLDPESSSPTYGRFIAEPFERGYGITVGNSLRRVLLSSLLGTSATALRIEGASHEFAAMPGIVEDVINIALNVKSLIVKWPGDESIVMKWSKKDPGPVTGADLTCDTPGVEVVNGDQVIATIEEVKKPFAGEIEFRKGRGYVRSEDATWEIDETIGTIPLDAAFSPVTRTRWRVEETRVGKLTNYDKLVLEIWTNGVLTPEDALVEASSILRHHLHPFVKFSELGEELPMERPGVEETVEEAGTLDRETMEVLGQPVSVIDPSVRAANCLAAEGVKTLKDLVCRQEADLLQVRNFGKTCLKEVKQKLAERGLSLGMKVD